MTKILRLILHAVLARSLYSCRAKSKMFQCCLKYVKFWYMYISMLMYFIKILYMYLYLPQFKNLSFLQFLISKKAVKVKKGKIDQLILCINYVH